MCKVTVYMPCFNYGRFVDTAIQSVIKQTLQDWELIVINDGSTDNSTDIINEYKKHPNIRIINQENKGLNVTNNIALRLSSGKYIMRLDADDFLDENALLVMSSVLDNKPEIGLVYPDYYHVDTEGQIVELIRRMKIEDEVQILDLPAHGACTMYRKNILLQLGGYAEEFSCQDGYEMWLRFIDKHNPYNVNIPLFYYRRHENSLTKDMTKILKTRRKIKRNFVQKQSKNHIPKVLGIIPATKHSIYSQADPFIDLCGKPLLWYTLTEAIRSKSVDRLVLSSENDQILEYASQFKEIQLVKREPKWSSSTTKMQQIIFQVLLELEQGDGYSPDAVCALYINTPLRRAQHIDKAIDTMTIFDVDSVIAVQEETSHCYFHRRFGLEPISKSQRSLRIERDAIYKENSSIYLSKTDVIRGGKLLGKKVGHIIMLPEESVKISSAFDHWLCENIIKGWSNDSES